MGKGKKKQHKNKLKQQRLRKEKQYHVNAYNEKVSKASEDSNSESKLDEVQKKLSALSIDPTQCLQKIPAIGLHNLGNTCFFNATLQTLSKTQDLHQNLREIQRQEDDDGTQLGSTTRALVKTLSEMLDKSLALLSSRDDPMLPYSGGKKGKRGRKGAYDPGGLLGAVRRHWPQFKGYRQQDAHELFVCLNSLVQEEEQQRLKKIAEIQNLDRRNAALETETKMEEVQEPLETPKKRLEGSDLRHQDGSCPPRSQEIFMSPVPDARATSKRKNEATGETPYPDNRRPKDEDEQTLQEEIEDNQHGPPSLEQEGRPNLQDKDIEMRKDEESCSSKMDNCEHHLLAEKDEGSTQLTDVNAPSLAQKDDVSLPVLAAEEPLNDPDQTKTEAGLIVGPPGWKWSWESPLPATLIDRVFGCSLVSRIICQHCQIDSHSIDQYLGVSLEIPMAKSQAGSSKGGFLYPVEGDGARLSKKERRQRQKEQDRLAALAKLMESEESADDEENKDGKANGDSRQKEYTEEEEKESDKTSEQMNGGSTSIERITLEIKDAGNLKGDGEVLENDHTQTVSHKQLQPIIQTSESNKFPENKQEEISNKQNLDSNDQMDVSVENKGDQCVKKLSFDQDHISPKVVTSDSPDCNHLNQQHQKLPSVEGKPDCNQLTSPLVATQADNDQPEDQGQESSENSEACEKSHQEQWMKKLQPPEADPTAAITNDKDKDKFTIEMCLKAFTREEDLSQSKGNGYRCVHCCKNSDNERRDAKKRMLFLRPPSTLVLHLKRLQARTKIKRHIQFQEEIDLEPFCWRTAAESENEFRPCQSNKYELYGVVVHSGGAGGGHYISYVKGPLNSVSSHWQYVSDSMVRNVTLDEVLRAEAYMLFYQSKQHSKQQDDATVAANNQVLKSEQTHDSNGTAIHHTLEVNAEDPTTIRASLVSSGEKDELYLEGTKCDESGPLEMHKQFDNSKPEYTDDGLPSHTHI